MRAYSTRPCPVASTMTRRFVRHRPLSALDHDEYQAQKRIVGWLSPAIFPSRWYGGQKTQSPVRTYIWDWTLVPRAGRGRLFAIHRPRTNRDHDDLTRGELDDLVRDAAKDEPTEATPAVRAQDDHVGTLGA